LIRDTKYKILNTILRGGLLLAVFVPLVIFRNAFSPFNFGKVVVFRTLIEFLLVIYVILALKYREFRPPGFVSSIWYLVFRIKYLVCGISYLVSKARRGFDVVNKSQAEKYKIQNTKYKIQNTIFLGLTLFTVSMVISTFIGVNWYKSFWGGGWERMGGLFSWLHYYAFFVMLVSVFREKEDWLSILWLSVFAALISSFYGFLQKSESLAIVGAAAERARILGTIGNPAALAGYLLFNFYFVLYLFSQYKNRGVKAVLVIIGLVFMVAIFMTAVRGAVLATAVSILYLVFCVLYTKFWKQNTGRNKMHLLGVSLAFIVLLLVGFYFVSRANFVRQNPTVGRLVNFSLKDPTIRSRLLVWKIALSGIFNANPSAVQNTKYKILNTKYLLFGWGPENFESIFSLHYNSALSKGSGTDIFDRAHNIFLDTAANQGIIGLVAFIFLWAGAIFSIRRFSPDTKYKILNTKYIFSALIVAYFIHNFFFFDLASTYIMLMVFWGLISVTSGRSGDSNVNQTSLAANPSKKPAEQSLKISPAIILPVAAASALLMGMLAYWANIKPAFANYYSTRGLVAFYNAKKNSSEKFIQKYNEGVNYFKKALDLAGWLRSDILRKFSELYIDTVIVSEGKVLEEDLKNDSEFLLKNLTADKERKNLEFSSYVYEYKTERLLALYINPELFSDIRAKQIEAIKKFPAVVELYYDLADSDFYLKDYSGLIKAYEKACELNPSVLESQFGLGQAYVLYSSDKVKVQEGMALLINSIKNGYFDPQRFDWLGKSLEEKKKYKEMTEIFEVLAEKHPEYNIQLSYSYLLLGQKNKAKEAANKAFLLPLNSRQNQMLFEILKRVR
jgi:O-antigen ligase/tetratricopeptide (TPR) repeat protein